MVREAMRIILLGAGVIAHHHAHAALRVFDQDKVVLWAGDPNEVARCQFAAAFPQARVEADAATLLAEPACDDDIAVVAVPPWLHKDLTIAALHSGRHTLCEKPLAMNMDEATAMLTTARLMNRRLGCCSCRFLGHPPTQKVRELLDDGELGEVYHVRWIAKEARQRVGIEYLPELTWYLDRSRSGGGNLQGWGPYDFAVINWLLEPTQVEVCMARIARVHTDVHLPPHVTYDIEDQTIAALRLTRHDGSTIMLDYEIASCTHGSPRTETQIEGTRGAVSWSWLDFKDPKGLVVLRADAANHPVECVFEQGVDERLGHHDKPLAFFAGALRGEPAPAVLDGQAVFNFACIRAIYDAARTGRPRIVRRSDYP
jgi:predicted dehydrogenase